jgi:hypothetical protein
MWGSPHYDNQLVTITFQPQVMTCSLITPSKRFAPLALQAYKKITFCELELESLIVFNATKISQHITDFLDSCNARNAFVACSLRGPKLFERFVPLTKADPSMEDFAVPEGNHMLWDYRFAYPADNGLWVFYVTGMPRSLLLQYQLLAISTQCNLITLTSERMALLKLYEYQHGAAFRRSQLAIDMVRHHNMIEYLFDSDTLSRILHIPSALAHHRVHDAHHLLSACGLFVSNAKELI